MQYSKYKVIFYKFEEDAIPYSEIFYSMSGDVDKLVRNEYPYCVIVSITKLD